MSSLLRGVELQPGVHRLARRGAAPEMPVSQPLPPVAAAQDLQATLAQARMRLEGEQRSWQQQAEQELAAVREQVRQEAHAAGHAQALAEVREAWREKLARCDALIDGLGALLGQVLLGAQDLVLALAFEAVSKILGHAATTPEGVRAVVVQAIAQARQQEKLVVRVPAEDYRLLIEDLPATHPLARPGIEIRPDAQLEGGGCVIDTDAGQIDARLVTQLEALRAVLLRARAQAAEGAA